MRDIGTFAAWKKMRRCSTPLGLLIVVVLVVFLTACNPVDVGKTNVSEIRSIAESVAKQSGSSPEDIKVDHVEMNGAEVDVYAGGTVVDATDLVLAPVLFGRDLCSQLYSVGGVAKVTLYWGNRSPYYVKITHTPESFSKAGVILSLLRREAEARRFFESAVKYDWLDKSSYEEARTEGGYDWLKLQKLQTSK